MKALLLLSWTVRLVLSWTFLDPPACLCSAPFLRRRVWVWVSPSFLCILTSCPTSHLTPHMQAHMQAHIPLEQQRQRIFFFCCCSRWGRWILGDRCDNLPNGIQNPILSLMFPTRCETILLRSFVRSFDSHWTMNGGFNSNNNHNQLGNRTFSNGLW